MKKLSKIFFLIFAVVTALIIGFVFYALIITSDVNLDKTKLVDFNKTITFLDYEGNVLNEESNNVSLTNIDAIPKHVTNAFIAIEDKRFYSHKGVDYRGLARAFYNNLKSFSFKEGASTISQQLIKNTHLSNEKTLKRKFLEIKLSKQLEKKYTKKEILEKYLNTIYFGNNCYGIASASKHYFNKKPEELTINESAALAGIIKAPTNYSPLTNTEKCNKRKNVVLTEMLKQNYITQNEYDENIKTDIKTNDKNEYGKYDYCYLAKKELDNILDDKRIGGNNIKVFTYCNNSIQNTIENCISDNENFNFDKSSLIIDKNGHYVSYKSTCGEIYRQLGSTLKPLAVYAPAIENDVIYSCSAILDEKTNFNGYSPSNYNDKYYGYVSAKDALSKSLNVPAVKILNSLGAEKALNYLNKTDIPVTKNDGNLSLALGATENGAKLSQLVSAYTVFLNEGLYIKPTCIDKITDENGNVIYKNKKISKKIFNDDTIYILNDMLKNAVKNGTAKKLSYNDFDIYAKTGTVGNKNGNSDAYTVSYTSDYILGFWCGNKDNSLMDNTVTGGSLPASFSDVVWKKIYTETKPNDINKCKNVIECNIDKTVYDEEHTVKKASVYTPKKFTKNELFKKNNQPALVSERFSKPKVDNAELLVNSNGISIQLCVKEYYDYKIYRQFDNKKQLVYDSSNGKKTNKFIDNNLIANKTYIYSVIPYFINDDTIIEGDETFLPKIKTPTHYAGEDWWNDDFNCRN